MRKCIQQYVERGLNCSVFGIELTEKGTRYFCTPTQAEIFAETGVDGIHYCFIEGFDDAVFVVNPSADQENFVHAVAKNFDEFLQVLMVCGNEAAVEQAYLMTEQQFHEFLKENPITPEQYQMIDHLKKNEHLNPMENVYVYLLMMAYDAYDVSDIEYSKEYYELFPKSEVKEMVPTKMDGPTFQVINIGQEIKVTSPITHTDYTLTVVAYQKKVDTDLQEDCDWEYPTHYHQLTYTITPENENEQIFVEDVSCGDSPRKKRMINDQGAQLLGAEKRIIYFQLEGEKNTLIKACASSFTFEEVENITWKLFFNGENSDNLTIKNKLGLANKYHLD